MQAWRTHTHAGGRTIRPRSRSGCAISLDSKPARRWCDLGAGTGKFTPRLIRDRCACHRGRTGCGHARKAGCKLPQVDARPGTADAIPLPDASVDAIVCAQSFHWFATHTALVEIHRVLKPGGTLGLIWNLRDARVPWVARLDAIVNRVEGDTPRYYTGAWRAAFPFEGLGPIDEHHFKQGHTGSLEDVIINRVRSTSFIAALERMNGRRSIARSVR